MEKKRNRTNARSKDARIRRSQRATLKKHEKGIFKGSNKGALEKAFMISKIHKMECDIIKLLFDE